MKLDLLDTRKLIIANGLKEVSNPILYETGYIPTPDGLLSMEIFGTTSRERKETYAYIDLGGPFLHPYVYKIMRRVERNIEHIVHGRKSYIITDDGTIKEDPEGSTGLTWLYRNWDKVKFKKNESNVRNERIVLLENTKKDVLFCKQWIVIPAFYRDVNYKNVGQGKISNNELTDLYCKLLKYANMYKSSTEFEFLANSTIGRIQDTLVELYDYFKQKIEKKRGLIRQSLLGKSVDYGCRAVITAPQFGETYKDNPVDFYHCGLPISITCTTFFPFVLYEMRTLFREMYEKLNYKIEDLSLYNPKLSGSAELAPFDLTYNEEVFKNIMDTFTRSYGDRFERIPIPLVEEQKYPIYYKINVNGEDRDMTYTDLLYIATYRAIENKHVYITRYPVLNHLGTFPNKVRIISTLKTIPAVVNGEKYDYYPVVDFSMSKNDVATFFFDVLKMSNVYLKAIGGDYDGDQTSIKGVFSLEANDECDKIVKSKRNILDGNGDNIRLTTNEAIQTLYCLTKRDPKFKG